MNDLYVFGGDSFTWGEGLELYINTPFWIEQRKKKSDWGILGCLQSEEAEEFRKRNRFAGLIASELNATSIVDDKNGGGLCRGAHLIDSYINQSPKAVVYQFTTLVRMTFHFSVFCRCNICRTPYGPIPNVINYYFECLHKKIYKKEFTEKDLFFLNRLKEAEGITITDEQLELFNSPDNKLIELFYPMFHRNMKYFIDTFIKKWAKTTKVLLINSWELETGRIVESNPFFREHLVPLKGYDGNYYLSYKEWENTFPYKNIADEFKGTENYHPTLLQHRYLADSITEALKN